MLPKVEIQDSSWSAAFRDYMQKPEWIMLQRLVDEHYDQNHCYPPKEKIFRAFELTPLNQVKVVILGQDPYHGANQANGLAFSVDMGQKIPPSLRNILKEALEGTSDIPKPDLTHWAEQGVFLLNTVLTVEEKKPGSHAHFGWEKFTDEVITLISQYQAHVAFMLWGQYAQKKESRIDTSKHLILKSAHPSPLSAYKGFLGCRHFIKANEFLREKIGAQVKW